MNPPVSAAARDQSWHIIAPAKPGELCILCTRENGEFTLEDAKTICAAAEYNAALSKTPEDLARYEGWKSFVEGAEREAGVSGAPPEPVVAPRAVPAVVAPAALQSKPPAEPGPVLEELV